MPLAAIDSFTPLVNVPDDFVEFWESTADTLAETPAHLQTEEVEAPAPHLTHKKIRFRSLDGVVISGYVLSHRDTKRRPLIVHSHGYNSQHDIMLNWANRDCHVLGIDFRAFGRSQQLSLANGGYVLTGLNSPATSILRGAVMDLYRAVELGGALLSEQLTKTVLYGFSFGGGMAIMASALGAAADFLVVGQPTFGWHSERLRLSKAGSSAEINQFLEKAPKERETVLNTLAYFDTLHFAARLKTPCLVGVGLDDDVVPSRSVIAIANHITEPRLEVRVLPVAHSDDPRESLWSAFDDEWLTLSHTGLPENYGCAERQVRSIDQ